MFYTDDPVSDYLQYDAEQEEELSKLPLCCECDEHITDEFCFEINGEYICEDCLNSHHKHWIDDIVD